MVPTKKGCIENDFDSRLSTPTFKLMKQFYNASIDCCYSIINITENTSNTSAGYENKTFITKA